MKTLRMTRLCAAAWLAAGLAACGGDGGGPLPPPDNRIPASALASAQAFVDYSASLAPDDRSEPLDLSGVVPPVSDTAEPVDRF